MDELREFIDKVCDSYDQVSEMNERFKMQGVKMSLIPQIYVPSGICLLADAVGQTCKAGELDTTEKEGEIWVEKKYSFHYRGIRFWGCVIIGRLEDMANGNNAAD